MAMTYPQLNAKINRFLEESEAEEYMDTGEALELIQAAKELVNGTVHVLWIDHPHGQDVLVFSQYQPARQHLDQYVQDNWGELEGIELPATQDERIDLYFSEKNTGLGDSESWDIVEVEVDPEDD